MIPKREFPVKELFEMVLYDEEKAFMPSQRLEENELCSTTE